ncbi:MAG: lysoplasmalogenase [Actinomycetota bacterium]
MTLGQALVAAAVVVAAVDWYAVARGNRGAEYVLKPLTMAVLMAAAGVLARDDPAYVTGFTIAALVLSLAGDVFLMVPRDLFVAGLASFLLAHVAYIAAFNPTPPPLVPTLVGTAVALAVAVPLYLRFVRGMRATNRMALAGPVAVYVLAITAMVVSAVATTGRSDWSSGESSLAIAGAVLFYASDGMIGWSRFVGDFPGSRIAIMATYHLAQVLLVLALLG